MVPTKHYPGFLYFILCSSLVAGQAAKSPSHRAIFTSVAPLRGQPAPIPVGNLSAALRQRLNETRAEIMQWALVVDGAAAQDECDTPSRGSCDCTFWNGILCSNPHARPDVSDMACSALSRSQSPNGMLWRSPWEAAAQNSTNPNFFSRDQGLGTLAATSRTRDGRVYTPWLKYIEANKGYMCPGKSDCTLTMPFWCTFDKVARHANLTEPPASLMVPKLGKSVCNNDHAFLYVSCSVNTQGSALHLAALDVYIRRMIPNEWDAVLQASANKLHSRDPLNPFFRWLAEGASDDLAALLISQVPTNNTTRVTTTTIDGHSSSISSSSSGSSVGIGSNSVGTGSANHTAPRRQWSFCREDSEKAYTESMGWEFIFLIDHLLATPLTVN